MIAITVSLLLCSLQKTQLMLLVCSATQLLQRISTMKYGSSVRQVMCNLWDHNEEEIVDVGENPISDQSILSNWSTMSLATSNYNT